VCCSYKSNPDEDGAAQEQTDNLVDSVAEVQTELFPCTSLRTNHTTLDKVRL